MSFDAKKANMKISQTRKLLFYKGLELVTPHHFKTNPPSVSLAYKGLQAVARKFVLSGKEPLYQISPFQQNFFIHATKLWAHQQDKIDII